MKVVAEEVFGWCGGAALLRASYLADVGPLDERFFAYYEDFDLSWRGRLLGWRYCYVPTSVVHHRHAAGLGVESERFRFLVGRNRLLALTKLAPLRMAGRAAAVEAGDGVWLDGVRPGVGHVRPAARKRRRDARRRASSSLGADSPRVQR